MSEARLRRSSRVFLFNERNEILLIRFVAQRDGAPFVFWVTPGGEVEPGESDLHAAGRELFEELGLELPLHGPVHEESGGSYVHLGETVRNFDVFFAARCAADAPRLTGVTDEEIALMREARWWSPETLEATSETVFPVDIAKLVRDGKRDWVREIGPVGSEL
ncbi:MAG TPA: NUDIX domain-containing protein [Acidobacteriaceae bacterium]|jgi:ADP-ribose pyrophosphatase YjhB (NUDIX family)